METEERDRLLLAPYAMHAANSAGREHAEPPHPYRSPYQRDRDRVVHSAAFRRLAHKTQVFTGSLGDYHRTRLTHTFEVASVARTVARAIALNEDLVETLALLHDLGHPPFGHAGEEVLDRRLADEGGFNHNQQAVRIATLLERRYPEFPGLNLSAEVLDSQRRRSSKAIGPPSPLLEAQVVDAADSIAYDAHDADDALVLGVLTTDELSDAALWHEATESARRRFANLSGDELRRAAVHALLDRQVDDLIASSAQSLRDAPPASPEEVRHLPRLIGHSDEMTEQKRQLESLLFERVYRHPRVLAHRDEAMSALESLYHETLRRGDLPSPYDGVARAESPRRAAADYVASVTDRFALDPAGADRAAWAGGPA
ncbi:MAG: dGTP triphosphohydrolase [Planctomycetota bacterium]